MNTEDYLLNIANGRATSELTSCFLLSAFKKENKLKENFITKYNGDVKRFEKPLKRHKIYNFASDSVKKVMKNGLKQVKIKHDIFGRLLTISLEKKFNMELYSTFQLASAPPFLFDINGAMNKIDESSLFKKLRSLTEESFPEKINVEIVDGFYLMYYLDILPMTYEKSQNLFFLNYAF